MDPPIDMTLEDYVTKAGFKDAKECAKVCKFLRKREGVANVKDLVYLLGDPDRRKCSFQNTKWKTLWKIKLHEAVVRSLQERNGPVLTDMSSDSETSPERLTSTMLSRYACEFMRRQRGRNGSMDIQNISITRRIVEAAGGEDVALIEVVGHSGCGKTTGMLFLEQYGHVVFLPLCQGTKNIRYPLKSYFEGLDVNALKVMEGDDESGFHSHVQEQPEYQSVQYATLHSILDIVTGEKTMNKVFDVTFMEHMEECMPGGRFLPVSALKGYCDRVRAALLEALKKHGVKPVFVILDEALSSWHGMFGPNTDLALASFMVTREASVSVALWLREACKGYHSAAILNDTTATITTYSRGSRSSTWGPSYAAPHCHQVLFVDTYVNEATVRAVLDSLAGQMTGLPRDKAGLDRLVALLTGSPIILSSFCDQSTMYKGLKAVLKCVKSRVGSRGASMGAESVLAAIVPLLGGSLGSRSVLSYDVFSALVHHGFGTPPCTDPLGTQLGPKSVTQASPLPPLRIDYPVCVPMVSVAALYVLGQIGASAKGEEMILRVSNALVTAGTFAAVPEMVKGLLYEVDSFCAMLYARAKCYTRD
ncbi:hypothetical protein KIPB_005310 [Kipferlia bialata]|uniref:Uncharacterized protein n=1 Tax=Kipferlia bialata TaxID=797122 RepID=A0A391NU08_9EUKA|nr:hypothetical protein KIPB_005310 [Kipferlia bialata]|eukprot:g5310.t1